MRTRIAVFEGYGTPPFRAYGRRGYTVAPLLPRSKRSGRIIRGKRRAGFRVKKARNTKAQTKFGKCARRCTGKSSKRFGSCMRKCMKSKSRSKR